MLLVALLLLLLLWWLVEEWRRLNNCRIVACEGEFCCGSGVWT